MKYKALRSFCGTVNARVGQELEISSKAVAKDLLSAGYIEPVEGTAPVEVAVEEVKKTAKKAKKAADEL